MERVQGEVLRGAEGNRAVDKLLELLRSGKTVTLLYAARSPYNNAVALKEYLESLLAKG